MERENRNEERLDEVDEKIEKAQQAFNEETGEVERKFIDAGEVPPVDDTIAPG